MKHILKSIKLKDKIRIFLMIAICVSFLFFSITTTYLYKSLFHQNTSQLMLKNFNLTYSNLEKIIENSKNTCAIIENDEKIYTMLTKEKDFIDEGANAFYEGYGTYLNMESAISISMDTYDIDGISVYTNSGCMYGDQGKTYIAFDQLKESKWYQYLQQNEVVAMFCNADYFSDAEQVSQGDLYYIKLIRSRTNRKYVGAIRIAISAERIENLLYSNSPKLNNSTFLQNDSGEIITPCANPDILDEQFRQTYEQSLVYNDESAIICQNITGTNLYLVSATSYQDAMADFHKIKFLIYTITFLIIAASYKLSKVFSVGITKRLNAMMDSMDNVKHGVFEPVPCGNHSDDIELCINNYNDMLSSFQVLLDTQSKHEAQKRKLQLSVLQEQIKPHFLYNTLELINNSAIINNIPEISEIVLELSSFYRLSLNQGSEMHTLKDELRHISLYFSLQNKRAQKPLSFFIHAPDELMSTGVPKLLLQPIMENSYYHAFPVPITKEDAKIEVTVKKVENDIIIEFYDNGIGIPCELQESILKTERSGGFGLKNIHERITLLYGADYGLSISSIPDTETTVTIKLPYNPQEN